MNEAVVSELCRLHIRMSDRTEDLAVPTDVPVADLLPALLVFTGLAPAATEAEEGGSPAPEAAEPPEQWVLQRLGDPPLDGDTTLASLDLHDGDTVHLLPRRDALPAAVLTPAGGREAERGRASGRSRRHAAVLLRSGAGAVLGLAVALAAWPGSSAPVRGVVAAVGGAVLLAAAALFTRALRDAAGGAVIGGAAVVSLAVAGWLLPGGPGTVGAEDVVLGSRLLSAGGLGAAGAAAALAVLPRFRPLFGGLGVVAFFTALWGALGLWWSVPPAHGAAVVAVLVTTLNGFVPVLSFRIAGMQMRPLPTGPDQLQERIDPFPSTEVARRSAVASGWMDALFAATGAVSTACLVSLAAGGGSAASWTAVVLALLLLLHGRNQGSVRQRLPVLLSGSLGLAALVLMWAVRGTVTMTSLAVALMLATAVLTIAVRLLPGRRLVPYWGRAAELAHSAAALALVPLALWVLGVYARLRAAMG
ncbi:type VII secretion integral membrane protein EccD [Streptomyces sp. NPDC035033]|uniref:type VII secretion integral membrane protein EccD n=1 Tax=Streptomyces sp. NPDC035033 TaxID=3155368 RepID=UPI00340FACAE